MSSLYLGSAAVLVDFLRHKSPLTGLVYASRDIPDKQKKAAYALSLGALRYKSVLDEVLEASNFMKLDRKMNRALVLVMMYDLLLSPSRSIQGGGAVKKLLMSHENHMRATFARVKMAHQVSQDEDLLPKEIRFTARLPRYVRVNTLRATVKEVQAVLAADGFQLQDARYDHREAAWAAGSEQHYFVDAHIPSLLVFSPGTDLHDHSLLTSGRIILQDKASCMTAAALDPTPDDASGTFHVLDACAAPGNKTTHLLAIAMEHCRENMPALATSLPQTANKSEPSAAAATTTVATNSQAAAKKRPRAPTEDDENDLSTLGQSRATGQQVSFELGASGPPKIQLEAFEVDPTRYQLLQRMMARALPTPYRASGDLAPAAVPSVSASCPPCVPARVTLSNRSFLDVDPRSPAYASVRAILLDPTCSGSGMLHRIEQFYKHRVEDVAPVGAPATKATARLGGLLTRVLPSGAEKAEVMSNVAQLAQFQTTILSHALSFPRVEVVAYSTCSVHAAEDEAVLETVLAKHPDFELATALPTWHRRGEAEDTALTNDQARTCVRSAGAVDGMNGFFVSKLVRKRTSAAAAASPASGVDAPTTSATSKGQKRARDEDDRPPTSAATAATGSQTARNRKKREKAKKRKLDEQKAANP